MTESDFAAADTAFPATILLIDSDNDRLRLTARLFEEEGYSVLTGTGATQAESLARLYHPHLLLIDAELPDNGGVDAARRVRLDPELAGVFVVLVFPERTRRRGAAGREDGVDAYLVRPRGAGDFLDRVEDFLRIREGRERLRQSEGRYRALLEANHLADEVQELSLLGGWKFDLLTGKGTWTDEVFRIYGVDKEFDFRDPHRAVSFYAPEDQPAVWRAFTRAVQDGVPYDLEARFIRSNGERIWVRTVGRPVLEQGKVVAVVGNLSEVTLRKQVEEALRESEERYRAIVDALDGVIYICSDDYRITFMNAALFQRVGRDVLGEHCYRALHGLDQICPWCVNERVFTGEVVSLEVQDPRDGRWYYAINSPIHNADGTVSKQAVIHDISHLKKAEKELQLKSFTLDQLADQVYWFSSECRILDVNQAACTKLGYSREELRALHISDIDPLYQQEDSVQHWEELRRRGSLEFEALHRARDGRSFPVEVRSSYLVHNEVEYNCCVVRDISERKNLEKALQESEELFRTLCDAAPIGIFRCDAEGNNIYCNPRWEEITGYSAGQGARKGWLSSVHPDDRDGVQRTRSEAIAAGRGFSHEHRKVTPEGKVIWVRVLVSPLTAPDGSVVGQVGTMEDITELRQARQEILKAQKLESIGVLAGGIAHDFNNILTAILGNVSLARYQTDDPGKVAQRLADAERAAARARELTQQLLTFARGGEPVKKVIRLRGFLREAVNFALHGANVRSELRIAEDVWPLEADQGQLAQVLHNLVLNAVQAMPEGGTVVVGGRNLEGDQGERLVEITVADTGAGIPEEHLDKIFDPYFTTKPHGSGLGLASCYSIVKKHGGSISVDSAPGKGSFFRLLLPASNQVDAAPPSLDRAQSGGGLSVLVMDDEEMVRVLVKAILEQLGYRAECAENGSRAVELYRQRLAEGNRYAAVILDLTVPGGMGGKETIRMLRGIDPAVKAIVCSGYSNDPVLANYPEYGFNAVLCKPYRPQDLGKVLQELLAESTAAQHP